MAQITDPAMLEQLNKSVATDAPAPDEHSAIEHYGTEALRPITSYPETEMSLAQQAVDMMKSGWGRATESLHDQDRVLPAAFDPKFAAGVGEMAVGGLGYVTSPLQAGYRSIIGQPVENITGIPKEITETVASVALPLPTRVPSFARAPTRVAPPTRIGGVTLSEGQASQDLSTIQREQAAVTGRSGPYAQRDAKAFMEQQKAELAAERDRIARSFDPYGGPPVAQNPREAGEVIQGGMQSAAGIRKADVDLAYKQARALPGEIHAGAFEGIGQKIKADLTMRDEPIIIDPQLTPFANRMIDEIDKNVTALKIPDRANPLAPTNMQDAVGVNLKGVDQWRKRLSAMRRDAFSSGNGADARAAKGVLDAFDDQVDAAVNGGLFSGDPRAIKAWNDARAAHSDYSRTFKAQKGDQVGRVVENIIGSTPAGPATPEKVINDIIGAQGVRPSDLNVKVTRRIKDVLGDRSPEWTAVKQGLFARLTETPEGVAEFGPGTVKTRIGTFLSNKSMANLVYSEADQALLRQYADIMAHIEIPRAGAPWSNTPQFLAESYKPSRTSRVLQAVGSNLGMAVSGLLAMGVHAGIGGLPVGGELAAAGAAKLAGMSAQAKEAAQIRKMMPVLRNVVRDYAVAGRTAESAPTARNIARLTIATRNLANNLRDVNLPKLADDVLRSLQGPAAAPAAPKSDKEQ